MRKIVFCILIVLSACQRTGSVDQSENYSLTGSSTNTSNMVSPPEGMDSTTENQIYEPEKTPTQTLPDYNEQLANLRSSYKVLQTDSSNFITLKSDRVVAKVRMFFESRFDMSDFNYYYGTNVYPLSATEMEQFGVKETYTISLGNKDYCFNKESISSVQIDFFEMNTIKDAVNMGNRLFNLADYALSGKNPEIDVIPYGDWGGLVLIGSPNNCSDPDALGYQLQVDMLRSNYYIEFRLFFADWAQTDDQKEILLSLVEMIDDMLTQNISN